MLWNAAAERGAQAVLFKGECYCRRRGASERVLSPPRGKSEYCHPGNVCRLAAGAGSFRQQVFESALWYWLAFGIPVCALAIGFDRKRESSSCCKLRTAPARESAALLLPRLHIRAAEVLMAKINTMGVCSHAEKEILTSRIYGMEKLSLSQARAKSALLSLPAMA